MGVSHFIVTGFAAGEGMDRGMCGCILFYCDKFCIWGRNGQGYVWVYLILL